MFKSALIAAALCFPLLSPLISIAAEAQPSWWDPNWQYRQVIEVTTPDHTGMINTAALTIEAGGADKNGADLRLVNVAGVPQKFEIVKAQNGVFTVQFEVANPDVLKYVFYYGNPNAEALPPQQWEKKLGGLHVTGKENTNRSGAPGHFGEMERMLGAAGKTYGPRDWPRIDDNSNPFKDEMPAAFSSEYFYLTYEGTIYCPVSGRYRFFTDSDDASFVFIDKEKNLKKPPLCYWPYGHSPLGKWDENFRWGGQTNRKPSPSDPDKCWGEIELEQGVHTVNYYFVQITGGMLARLGWKKPGDTGYSVIGEEYYVRELHAKPIARQVHEKPLNAFFDYDIVKTLQFDGQERPIIHVQFHDRSTSGAKLNFREWNFGDGSPAVQQPEPDHVYTVAGDFPVSLEVHDDAGYKDVVHMSVQVRPRNANRVSIFMNAAEGEVVAKPTDPIDFHLRFQSTADEDLPAILYTDVFGTAGEALERRQEEVTLWNDKWTDNKPVRVKFPSELGEINFRLEHNGVSVATYSLRVAYARDLVEPLTLKENGLIDSAGRRVIVRVGSPDGPRENRLPLLLRQGKPVKILVIDDGLSPASSEEAIPSYYDLLKERMQRQFGADVEVKRIGLAAYSVAPLDRLVTVPMAAKENPADIIIIPGGIEDIIKFYTSEDHFERLLWALVERTQGMTPAPVMLITPPPFVSSPQRSTIYARVVKRVALRTNVEVADAYSIFAQMGDGWKELYRDESKSDPVYYFSPRARGQAIIAECLYERIFGGLE